MKKITGVILSSAIFVLSACSYTAERTMGTSRKFLRDEVVSTHKEKELQVNITGRPTGQDTSLRGTIKGADVEYEDFVKVYQEIETVNKATSTISTGLHMLIWTVGWVVAAPLWAYPTWHEDMKTEANYHVGFKPGDYKSAIGSGKSTIYTTVTSSEREGRIFRDTTTYKRKSDKVKPKIMPAPDAEITVKSKTYDDLTTKGQIELSGDFALNLQGIIRDAFNRQYGKPQSQSLVLEASSKQYGKFSQDLSFNEFEVIDIVFAGRVDWSTGELKGAPYPVATVEMETPGTLEAGEIIKARITIDNTRGKGDLFRLYAQSHCDSEPSINGYNVLFGRIKAGEKKVMNVTYPTTKQLKDKKVNIKLTFHELNGYIPNEQRIEALVKSVPHADFAVHYQIFDGPDRGVGNGNGILERGEAPECELAIRNTGNAPSGNVSINIEKTGDEDPNIRIFGALAKKSAAIGVGEVLTHSFDISLKKGFQQNEVKFNVTVQEDKYNIQKVEQLNLVIGETTKRESIAINKSVRVVDDKTPIYSGASKQTDLLGSLPQGAVITATHWLGDFYKLNLGNNKIGWVETSKVKEVQPGEAVAINSKPPTIVFESDNNPIVAITSPKNGFITDTKKIKVDGFARDDKGLKTLKIFVNGTKVSEKGIGGTNANFEEEITLSDGTNKIEVAVEDIKGQVDKMVVEASYFGKYPILTGFYKNVWAVIIGIDRFEDKSIPTLEYAVRDAKGIEEMLKNDVVAGKVLTLYNEEATRENILRLLLGELSQADKDDAIFIYMAMHGKTFETGRGTLGDLIPYDGSMNERERYKNISMQTFKDDIARQIRAKHMLVVVDACYGGVLTRGVGIKMEDTEKLQKDDYLKGIKDKEAKIVITAGADKEEVLDKGPNNHSVFTGRLIETVNNSSYFISSKELFSQVKWKVQEDASRRGHKQTPQFGYWWGEGDFIFIRK